MKLILNANRFEINDGVAWVLVPDTSYTGIEWRWIVRAHYSLYFTKL
jgi:hypothetical protein